MANDDCNVRSVGNKQLCLINDKPKVSGINICPLSKTRGKRVFNKTLANHVRPVYWPLINNFQFYFCEEQICPVIYFYNPGLLYFSSDEVHSVVMQKMAINDQNRPMCYCKNVLESQILNELIVKKCCDSLIDIQNFTGANTGKYCVIANPSGRCCGDKIRELLEWIKENKPNIELKLIEEAINCCENIEISSIDTDNSEF